MKKLNWKKIIVCVLAVALLTSVATGCSLVEYNEDRDLEQVVIRIDSFDMEYNIPVYTDYKDDMGNAVTDGGNVVQTVMRLSDGSPVHMPALDEDGNIKYMTNPDNPTDTTYAVDKLSSAEYVSFTITGGAVTDAVIYEYEGLDEDKNAAWRNMDTMSLVLSDSVNDDTAVSAGTKRNGLPTIHYTKADGSDWYYNYRNPEIAKAKWTTEAKEYTRQSLIARINSSAQTLLDQGFTLEETCDQLVEMLGTMYFLQVEAENYIKSGEVEWGITEQNNVTRAFYTSVDSALETIFAEIYAEHDQEYTTSTAEEETPEYPVREEEEAEQKDYYIWKPDADNYLGLGADTERDSAIRTGIRRWIENMSETIEDDYSIGPNLRAVYENELIALGAVASKNDTVFGIYPSLLDKNEDGSYKYSVVWYLYGENNEVNLKTSALTAYIGESNAGNLGDEAVVRRYNDILDEQRTSFSSNVENYTSAITGNSLVLYYPSDSYFSVKHILLPLDEAETTRLTAMRDSGNYSDKSINELRDQLAADIVVYPHPGGISDTDSPMTLTQAYSHIKNYVEAGTTPYEKDRAFTDMIYLYNTDPGVFENEGGYAVATKPAAKGGPDETYMIEFATAARDLRTKYLDGNGYIGMISEPVLTDYGYHIMFLLKVPGTASGDNGEVVGLNDYLTPGRFTTVYESLSASLISAAHSEAYNSWSSRIAKTYKSDKATYIHIFKDAYKSLYED